MIRVIGFGNSYHGDDGFGPRVIERLAEQGCPSHISLIEGGILGLDAAPLFEKCQEVIIIDASRGGLPGTVEWLDAEEIIAQTKTLNLTTHGFAIPKLLQVLPIALGNHAVPKIRFLAGWIEDIQVFRQGLSETAMESVEKAVTMVVGDPVWRL